MSKPKAIYIVGGAGSGKSTLMGWFLEHIQAELQPLTDMHVKRNKRFRVTLRGQAFDSAVGPGVYLGLMRDKHPGTDGLDRASTPTAVEWLEVGDLLGELPAIVAEGATLSTKAFFQKLAETHDLLVVHLVVSEEERQRRFDQRGTTQKDLFVKSTISRGRNMAEFASGLGAEVLTGDTSEDGVAAELVHYMEDFLKGEMDE